MEMELEIRIENGKKKETKGDRNARGSQRRRKKIGGRKQKVETKNEEEKRKEEKRKKWNKRTYTIYTLVAIDAVMGSVVGRLL